MDKASSTLSLLANHESQEMDQRNRSRDSSTSSSSSGPVNVNPHEIRSRRASHNSTSSGAPGRSRRTSAASTVSTPTHSVSGYVSPMTWSPGSSISWAASPSRRGSTRSGSSTESRLGLQSQPGLLPPPVDIPWISNESKILGIMASLKPIPAGSMAGRIYAAKLLYRIKHNHLEEQLPNLENRAFWYVHSQVDDDSQDAASSKPFRMALFSTRFIYLLRALHKKYCNDNIIYIQEGDINYPVRYVHSSLHRLNVLRQTLQAEKSRSLALSLVEPDNELYVKLMQAMDNFEAAFS